MSERTRIKDIAKLAGVSVGTVDRVIHGRSGVSEASKKRVKEILKQLDYQPNMYASALASNKKYLFACLLPQHHDGEYWTAVEKGIHAAIATYSDFHITVSISYYDPYNYSSFLETGEKALEDIPEFCAPHTSTFSAFVPCTVPSKRNRPFRTESISITLPVPSFI